MPTIDEQLLIDQISRVVTSLGWDVITTDTGTDVIRITIQHIKPPPKASLAQGARG